MAPFLNTFSWSASRDRLFRECPRAYYYNYYGYWNGWSYSADEKTKLIYQLKKIQNVHLWAGSIVHDVIKDALEDFVRTQTPPTAERLLARAKAMLRQGWIQSTSKDWLKNKKATNLFELYYGNGKTLPAEMTDMVKEKVYSALQAFADSEILKTILSIPTHQWKPIDELNHYMLDDIKIWCAIDFAYTDNQGCLQIIDWKTGKEKADELYLQLAGYGWFAHDIWHYDMEQIKCHGVFLNEGARVSHYEITPEDITKARAYVLASRRDMVALLDDAENNKASEDKFEPQPNASKCSRCNYKAICEAACE